MKNDKVDLQFLAVEGGAFEKDMDHTDSALIVALVMTFMFLMIILGATDRRAPAGFAPIVGALRRGSCVLEKYAN